MSHYSKKLIYLAGLVYATSFSFALADDDQNVKKLLRLSLSELLDIKVSGQAVRDLSLEEIPITENPSQTTVQWYPATIELMNRKTIKARGLRNIVEVTNNLVGVQSGESPSEPYSFSMRGFSRDSVNVLYDGVSMGVASLNMRPQGTHNVEQVEIVKGPYAINHGQGASGGSVNIITRRPQMIDKHVKDIELLAGDFNTYSIGSEFLGPIGDSAAYLLNVHHDASDGWVDRAESESTNVLAKILFQSAHGAEYTLSLNYLSDHLPGHWGTPFVPASYASEPDSSVITTSNDQVIDLATRYRNYNVMDQQIESDSLWTRLDGKYEFARSVFDFKIFSFTADRDWLNSESYTFDIDTELVQRDRLIVLHDRELSGIHTNYHFFHSGEWQATSTFHFEYSDNKLDRVIGFDIESPNPYTDTVDLYNPVPGRFGEVAGRDDSLYLKISALSYQLKLQPTKQLSLDLSVRSESLDVDRKRFELDGSPRARAFLNDTINQTSFRLASSYQYHPKLNIYAHYSSQHDPIESDITGGVVYDLSYFEPTEVEQFEAGFKGSSESEKTEWSASWFQIERILTTQQPDEISVKNDVKSNGIELAIKHQFSEQFRLGGNFSYVDIENGSFFNFEFGEDASGKTPYNVPDKMFSLWGSYNEINGMPLEIGAGVSYVGDRYGDASNSILLNSYTTMNAFATYTLDDSRISLHINNLTDEVYAPWFDIFYPNQVLLAAPRTISLTWNKKF